MKWSYLVIVLLLLNHPMEVAACSCFGPSTFCGTLHPNYEPPFDPSWWIPDAVVLGVKVASVGHGMDVRVLTTFSGVVQMDEIIRIWGDNGILCRMYIDAWEVGDTAVWGIKRTDQAGGAMEMPNDHMLSVCGIYWLDYANGSVTGPIMDETSTTIPVDELWAVVKGCLSAGVPDVVDGPALEVSITGEELMIRTTGSWSGLKYISLMDASGRILEEATFNGPGHRMNMGRYARGVVLLQVRDGKHQAVRKVMRE